MWFNGTPVRQHSCNMSDWLCCSDCGGSPAKITAEFYRSLARPEAGTQSRPAPTAEAEPSSCLSSSGSAVTGTRGRRRQRQWLPPISWCHSPEEQRNPNIRDMFLLLFLQHLKVISYNNTYAHETFLRVKWSISKCEGEVVIYILGLVTLRATIQSLVKATLVRKQVRALEAADKKTKKKTAFKMKMWSSISFWTIRAGQDSVSTVVLQQLQWHYHNSIHAIITSKCVSLPAAWPPWSINIRPSSIGHNTPALRKPPGYRSLSRPSMSSPEDCVVHGSDVNLSADLSFIASPF